MPSATREDDKCSGHGCWPPRDPMTYSPTVFINGKAAIRRTDLYKSHECPLMGAHMGELVKGSSTVFINGLDAGRIGDVISCGSIVAMGSDDVFIGG